MAMAQEMVGLQVLVCCLVLGPWCAARRPDVRDLHATLTITAVLQHTRLASRSVVGGISYVGRSTRRPRISLFVIEHKQIQHVVPPSTFEQRLGGGPGHRNGGRPGGGNSVRA